MFELLEHLPIYHKGINLEIQVKQMQGVSLLVWE